MVTPAASEPASGSLNSWHQITWWVSAARTQRDTCSGVPYWISVRITQPVIPYCGRLIPAAANSCSITSCSIAPALRPYGSGQWGIA